MQPVEVPPEGAERAVSDLPAASAPPQVALSVAGAARGLGVAPATLRSWERRYGMVPSLHTTGGHRRYGPVDLARLALMNRLVQEGAPPAEAARAAIDAHIDARAIDAANPFATLLADASGQATADVQVPEADEADGSAPPVPGSPAAGSPGGGRVLSLPRQGRSVRGLARAAMALDTAACQRTVSAALAEQGTIATWEDLVRPVLAAIGDKWSHSKRGVEIEHAFAMVVAGSLAGHSSRLARPRNNRPVLLASVPDELHDLPLLALQAALADAGVFSLVLGARTPDQALKDAVARVGPPVVVLFALMPGAAQPELPAVRPTPTVLRGGPGWADTSPAGHVSDLEDAVGAVCTAMGLPTS